MYMDYFRDVCVDDVSTDDFEARRETIRR